jgi:1-acyl-sn-glycerol-3-phosphate acyltransferase
MRTVFTTPGLTPALRWLARRWLRQSGWRIDASTPLTPPCVLIGAPHTSNWDFILLVVAILDLELDVRWMGKHTLFRFPFGALMRWLGGLPIDRTRTGTNVVAQTVAAFTARPDLIVCIPPEGTRRKVTRWRTGFYHIALGAGVPIVMAGVDGAGKTLRILGAYRPTGAKDRELGEIQQYYRGYRGLRPGNAMDLDAGENPDR